MSGCNHGETESPADTLIQTPPPDDVGADTLDRYEWQCMMATADVLAALLDCLDEHGAPLPSATFAAICEHHEDWALTDGHAAEIVSAKHKETGAGAFTTIRKLLVDGGVLHLLERWLALGQTPRCRLVTTAGLADDARTLLDTAAIFADGGPDGEAHDDILRKFAAAVSRAGTDGTPPPDRDVGRATLVKFLAGLRVQDSMPARNHVPFLAPAAYARPVAARLGAPGAEDAIWGAVLGLVRERMRAAGPQRRGRLPVVLGARDEAGHEARTVILDDVLVAVGIALENQSGFRPLPRRIRTSKLAIKMTAGGCSDNAVERAETLRGQYRQYWRDQQSVPSLDPTQRRVENTLLRVIDEATDAVQFGEAPWGRALWREVQARVDAITAGGAAHGLDADLLMGGVSDLTSECRAWFSDRFDVEAEARRLAQLAITVTSNGGPR